MEAIFIIAKFDLTAGTISVVKDVEFNTYPEAQSHIEKVLPAGHYQIQKIFKKN